MAESTPVADRGCTALVAFQTPLSGEVPETAWVEWPRLADFIPVLQVFTVQEIVVAAELKGDHEDLWSRFPDFFYPLGR